MENNIQSKIDEAIEDAINQLNRLEKGSPEYNQMVTNIAKLNEQRLREAELDATANSKAMERAIEDEKMAHEKALKDEETRQTRIKAYVDLGKSVLSLADTVGINPICVKF